MKDAREGYYAFSGIHHPVINIVVAGNLVAVVSVEFDDPREIIVDCIEFKVLFRTPFNSFR